MIRWRFGGNCLIWDLRHSASTICYRYHYRTIRCCYIFYVQNNIAKLMLLYATLYPFKIGMNQHFLASSTYDILSCCLAAFTLPKGLSYFKQLQTIYVVVYYSIQHWVLRLCFWTMTLRSLMDSKVSNVKMWVEKWFHISLPTRINLDASDFFNSNITYHVFI